jgi:molybdopterin/thiamine biosynthesis adenylyltransferase
MQPDYSRQILLKDVGTAGQAILAQSRVLIVGAGGLGSPVLQYLAGAGVGFLGLVEADVLEASNLHRQPIYELAQVGRPKAALAAAAVAKINPTVQVETHAERFGADNALQLVQAHDVVVDCTDNFRTKFLINDAAVLAGRPAGVSAPRLARLFALCVGGSDRGRPRRQLRRGRRLRSGARRFRRFAGAPDLENPA